MTDDGPRLVGAEDTGLIHRVAEPDKEGPHPTVIMLHGRGGNEDVMWIFARALPSKWLIVAPRGIKDDPEGDYAWHPRQRDEWPSLAQFGEAVDAVTDFIETLPKQYDADPDRIYLMGFSQGAATAYATAMRHPGLVQGIAGLVGFVPVECGAAKETEALGGLPILMIVGKEDPLIPYSRSERCAETLEATGADLTYKEYESGHRLNTQAMRDLKAWWQERANSNRS